MSLKPKGFGTFAGVFTPTTITILGVIMYLRQGWVVGNAGLFGAWIIIGISVLIAGCTALSLSSISTNTRLHAGGAYAIISRSLGLEAGGSIGIALYLAQTFAVTMYIFGFREGWVSLFPSHSPWLIDVLTFFVVFCIAFKSAKLATQVQYFVLAVTALSLVCVAMGPWYSTPAQIEWWGQNPSTGGGFSGFWGTFAVYFPAVTGVMAGANLSGELRDPRRSIPRGTLTAVVLCAGIYFWLAYVLAQMAPADELINNTHLLAEQSRWGWFVDFAILCATSSSALATLVGAPRILQALAKDGALPSASFLSKQSEDGEPRNALFLTGMIVFTALLMRDLNAIAPVITIFFLTTYAAVNGVVVIEQGLGLVNFRPRMRLPISIPLIGTVGSFFAMLIINPAISIVSVSTLMLTYAAFTKRRVSHEHGDVRGNIIVAMARWLSREAQQFPQSEARAWLPHPLCPILDGQQCRNGLELATDIAYPKGAVKLIRISSGADLEPFLPPLRAEVVKNEVHCTDVYIETPNRVEALLTAIQTLRCEFFRPNILSLGLDDGFESTELAQIFVRAQQNQMGIVLRCPNRHKIGQGGWINVWIRPQAPNWDVEEARKQGNMDLALLVGLRLAQQHSMRIRLLTTLSDQSDEKEMAEHFLGEIIELARLPINSDYIALRGNLWEGLSAAPESAVSIFGISSPYDPKFINRILEERPHACLFVQSSGLECVLV